MAGGVSGGQPEGSGSLAAARAATLTSRGASATSPSWARSAAARTQI